ncbi:MAG: response regulator [Burkholderiales bacterium]|nr:response regulator [Burkholderiales bacterium]
MTTVLLVDDNEVNRYLAQYLMEQAGIEVVTATNGHEALRMARARRPQLILMDIQMPVLDGYTATEQIKADPQLSGIPVVALTTFAGVADRERALGAGCVAHIAKPLDPDSFLDQVRAYAVPA